MASLGGKPAPLWACKFPRSEHHPGFPHSETPMAESISGPDLQTRLARLEQQLRWSRGLAFLYMAVGGGGALVAFKAAPPDVLQAQRIELVTGQGVRQAQFAADSLGLTVTLFDVHGL